MNHELVVNSSEHIIFVKDPDKMPNKCSVPKCSGRGGFTFPSDPEKRLEWKTEVKISWEWFASPTLNQKISRIAFGRRSLPKREDTCPEVSSSSFYLFIIS